MSNSEKNSMDLFRTGMLAKLTAKAVEVKFKRRGPNQHEIIEDTIAKLDTEFRAKAARVLEESGKFTEITHPTGYYVEDPEVPQSIESRFAAMTGFRAIRDFMIFFPRVQGDMEDIVKSNAIIKGLSPVIGKTGSMSKSFTLVNQEHINDLVLDLFEGGFYGVHDSDDVMAFDEKNLPIFRAGVNFTRKGNLGTNAVECQIRYAADNTVVEKFLNIVKRHVAVSGAVDAGIFDTIIGFKGGSLDIQSESLQDAKEAVPSFYPWMGEVDVASYIREFLESSANVLVLFGEPGGGKTTMIRTAVKRLGLRALGTADQRIMNSEGFIQQCGIKMSGQNDGSRYDLLVAEDADILASKRTDGNTVMSALLNALDGATKETAFKLVITTNKKTLADMDPALLRAGRCFDVMEFGRLTAEQAEKVREDLLMPELKFAKGSTWMLAEVLNRDTTKTEIVEGHAIVRARFPLQPAAKK